nr:phosphatidylethanolamine-binding protein 4 isoform X5 [Columba livia]
MKSLAVQREKCEDRLRRGSLCTLQGETEAARSPTHSEKLGFGRRAELFCSSWTGLKLRGTISMATSKLQSCLPIFRTCWPSRGGHQVHQMEPGEGRMKLLGAVLLGAVLLSSPAQLSKPEEQPQVCYFDVLSGRDSRFCRGELQVIYPDVGDVSCIYMPKCHQYRWRIIRDWMRPRVRFPQADENKKYVLVLADPDTPSREKPWNQYWRHWLVADIPVTHQQCSIFPICTHGAKQSARGCAGDDRLCTDVHYMIIIIILPRIRDERDDYDGYKEALVSRGF